MEDIVLKARHFMEAGTIISPIKVQAPDDSDDEEISGH